jgi:hypothetical protein
LSDFLVREKANAERWFVFDVVVERDLGARQQTNRDMRLADGSEATGDGIAGAFSKEFVIRVHSGAQCPLLQLRADTGSVRNDSLAAPCNRIRCSSAPQPHISTTVGNHCRV